MSAPSRPLSSHPHVRDLLGVAVYALGIAVIAAAVYAGVLAAAPIVATGAVNVSETIDETLQSESASRPPSNFEQWVADREAANRPQPPSAKADPEPPAIRVPPAPTGIAAAAKAKALAELGASGGGRTAAKKRKLRDDAVLPSGAQPAEQTNYAPPPAIDKHRVY